MADDKQCGHRAGRVYQGVTLICEKRAHTEGLHVLVITQEHAEAVFWDGGGDIVAINRLVRGVTLIPPDATDAMTSTRLKPQRERLKPQREHKTTPTLVPPPSPSPYQTSDGEPCGGCGGLMIRTGACLTCQNCGANTGCG